jgi:hypothetical protein
MYVKTRLLSESTVAYPAGIRSLSAVNSEVSVEVLLVGEILKTHGATVRRLSAMPPYVNL